MYLSGVTAEDLIEIGSLNRRYLQGLRQPGMLARRFGERLGRRRLETLRSFDAGELRSISECPFSLFCVSDLTTTPTRQKSAALFAASDSADQNLKIVALSFAWQLSHRDAFAVCVLLGGDGAWCEYLRAHTLMGVAETACASPHCISPVLDTTMTFWDELIASVKSHSPRRLRAVRALGFQHLAYHRHKAQGLALAARKTHTPQHRAVDKI